MVPYSRNMAEYIRSDKDRGNTPIFVAAAHGGQWDVAKYPVNGLKEFYLNDLDIDITDDVEELKNYLRVDHDEDDVLIMGMVTAAKKLCMDILRTDDEVDLDAAVNGKIAVLFAAAYMYEHREEADHHALDLTLRALLFGSRKPGF